ncbi:MAG: hypothetical protein LBF38_06695 [Deltaproteobacteria bacterium]|jgi:hypothetical protein|nr:hypothetical protein [Deltaproteobacteria bacterium]
MKTLAQITLAIFFLALFVFGPAAQAQDANNDPYIDIRPTISPFIRGLRYTTLLNNFVNPNCPNLTLHVGFTYPLNTGSPAVDAFLVKFAQNTFTALSQKDFCLDGNDQESGVTEHVFKFTAEIAGNDYLSIFFNGYHFYAGAAHPLGDAASFIFNVKTHRRLELSDIFENPKQSIPLLWPLLVKGWCRLEFKEIPTHYKISNGDYGCGRNIPPIPSDFLDNQVSFDVLGEVFLNHEGMGISLTEPFTHADGRQQITIGREDLLQIGAKPEIWR